ncbi:hypothetical protein BH10ACT8_BH10ACT8_16200 [soil metagenome]|jgi:sulfate adenylyltransferase
MYQPTSAEVLRRPLPSQWSPADLRTGVSGARDSLLNSNDDHVGHQVDPSVTGISSEAVQDWPRHEADLDLGADIALILSGVILPLDGPLQRLDAAASVEGGHPVRYLPAGTHEQASTALSQATEAGGVVFVDDELTPVAALRIEPSAAPEGSTASAPAVAGMLYALSAATEQLAHRLSTPADAVRGALSAAPVLAVLRDRPLTVAATDQLRRARDELGAQLLLLGRVSGSQTLLPDATLLQSLLATADELGGATVVAVPLPSRHRRAGLASMVLARYGATHVMPGTDIATDDPAAAGLHIAEVAEAAEPTWPEVLANLDRPGQLPEEFGSPATRKALRDWRAPRADRGVTIFFTGLSGSGKSTIAAELAQRLADRPGRRVTLMDGDRIRKLLSSGLGFSKADRETNIRRIGWVAAEVTRHGGFAVCAPIAPYAATRAWVRHEVSQWGDFLLIHVATPLEVCEARDRKGLYAAARAGKIASFTGISDPYEAPVDADLVLDTVHTSVTDSVETVLGMLVHGGWLPA